MANPVLKLKLIFSGLLLQALLLGNTTSAQTHLSDSAYYQRMVGSVSSLFKEIMRENLPLYNGREYLGYVKRPTGHPFLDKETMQLATIEYDGAFYEDSILYDLENDEVIIKDYTGNYSLTVTKEKINFFQISNREFVRISQDSSEMLGLEPGFYERIYNEGLVVLVKRKKQVYSITGREEVVSRYMQYNSFYLRNKEGWHQVVDKNSLIQALQDKKNEMREFLQGSNSEFRRSMEKAIIKAARHYDELKK